MAQKCPKIAKVAQKLPKMAQKLAPAEKNSTNWLARMARFCNSAQIADCQAESFVSN